MFSNTSEAKTGIHELDQGLKKYFHYLAKKNILPNGNYALAGGAIRCLFDNTRLMDLDIYILGSEEEHDSIINDIARVKEPQTFANPFASFVLANIPNNVNGRDIPVGGIKHKYDFNTFEQDVDEVTEESLPTDFKPPIQLISFKYDSNYAERDFKTCNENNRFADTYANSLENILDSFDLSISKAGVEFNVNDNCINVSSVIIPHEFLISVCLRKLIFNNSNPDIPQQICSLKRFHKLTSIGYSPNEKFFYEWTEKFKHNPYVLALSYV